MPPLPSFTHVDVNSSSVLIDAGKPSIVFIALFGLMTIISGGLCIIIIIQYRIIKRKQKFIPPKRLSVNNAH